MEERPEKLWYLFDKNTNDDKDVTDDIGSPLKK